MELIHLDEIDSTNEYAKKNITEFKDMTVIYADKQTSGHGRLGRKWVDTGADNLYMTFVLKPFSDMNPIYPNFTQYLSVILSLVLEEYGVASTIKWPNDVLVNGLKIAGILSEGTTKGSQFLGLALGIGVNLNTTPEILATIDKPATSLFAITNKKIQKEDFIIKLLSKFCLLYDNFINEGFSFIKEEYIKRASFLNTKITINILGEIHTGIAEDITDNGSILLNENNIRNEYYIGDIL